MQDAKVSEEALQIPEKREAKGKGERERHTSVLKLNFMFYSENTLNKWL